MQIAIIGAGNVGGTLRRRWAQNGHAIVYGVREPQGTKMQVVLRGSGVNARAATMGEAVAACDLVLLATPWGVTESVICSVDDWTGKILVDATNPLTPDLRGLALGHTTSAAEQIAIWAPGARVVKAFNSTGAQNMADPIYGANRVTMFVCGEDVDAKTTVMSLVTELDFEALDAGPLSRARDLEPLAMLWIHLAYSEGMGPDFAFTVIRR